MGAYDAWANSKKIHITGGSSAQTDYQITNLFIPYLAGMYTDFRDIRFANSSGTALPYFIEESSSGNYCRVSVKVDSIPAY